MIIIYVIKAFQSITKVFLIFVVLPFLTNVLIIRYDFLLSYFHFMQNNRIKLYFGDKNARI